MDNLNRVSVLKGRNDFLNIMYGGAFLGSGGGGPISAALQIIDEIMTSGGVVLVVHPEELKKFPDFHGAVAAFMGSPSQGAKGIDMSSPIKAFDALSNLVKTQKLDFVLPIELGAGNSLVPIMTAVKKGIPVVDADGACRAVPKIQNTVYALEGNATPAALANGNTGSEAKAEIQNIIMVTGIDREEVPDNLEAYALEICETTEFGGIGGLAMYLMNGEEVDRNTISGTMSMNYYLGETIRTAVTSGGSINPVNAVAGFLDSIGWTHYTFGEGIVTEIKKTEKNTDDGLDHGYVMIKDQNNNDMKISYINENMFAELNGKCWGMAPDMICYMTPDGPISNVEIQVGMRVTIFGLCTLLKMRNPKIVETFMKVLHTSGIYSGEYIMIEELH